MSKYPRRSKKPPHDSWIGFFLIEEKLYVEAPTAKYFGEDDRPKVGSETEVKWDGFGDKPFDVRIICYGGKYCVYASFNFLVYHPPPGHPGGRARFSHESPTLGLNFLVKFSVVW